MTKVENDLEIAVTQLSLEHAHVDFGPLGLGKFSWNVFTAKLAE